MSNYAKLDLVDISNIKIKGWLKHYLKLQENGLTGHLEVAGFPFNQVSWGKYDIDTTLQNDNPGWWAYEQTAYWLDGMQRCGELLNSEYLLNKAKDSFNFVLTNKDKDGYLGPKFLKETDGWNRWPHVVFFRALLSYYDYTKDESILDAITNHYLNKEIDYSNARDILNIEIMLLVYLKKHNEKLLDLAIKNYEKYNLNCQNDLCEKVQLSNKKPYAHGVSYNEYSKLGALLYIATNDKKYLKASIKSYKKIDKYFMLVDGLHCSNEFLIGNDYMQSHETCNISDYTWAMGYLLMATKDGSYADKIERCVFNAGIGSIDEKFKALQYFSCPNQVILDNKSNHNLFFKGDKWMSYRPNPGTECCAGNVNRFLPIYCSKMYMKKDDSLYAVLYGESEYNDGNVVISQQTKYPFDDKINFIFNLKENKEINFNLRIPGWCLNPKITVNGRKISFTINKGFVSINRTFKDNDIIELELPSNVEVLNYKNDGMYVNKGPLLYCFGMYGVRRVDELEEKQTADFKAYNIYPNMDFNYTICEDEPIEFVHTNNFDSNDVWNIEKTPFKINVKAKKVLNWKIKTIKNVRYIDNLYNVPYAYKERHGSFRFTPKFPQNLKLSEEKYNISLIPYGCAKVRIAIFPKKIVK